MEMVELGTIVLAIGALGTASFGVVDAFKWIGIGLFGFGQTRKLLGSAVMEALGIAYGAEYMLLLKAQYRANRTSGELPKSLRQGAGCTLVAARALG